MSISDITLRKLRGRWKPHKLRLSDVDPEHPTNVRFHRACSWFQRAEQITERSDLDFALAAQWIALNALYGQWDPNRRQAQSDVECWRAFLKTILELDSAGIIPEVLVADKQLVLSLFDDEYLNRYFWRSPSQVSARKNRRRKNEAQLWYAQQKWLLLLDDVVDRIYLVRCQLVHGAATFNSQLNRTAIRRCTTFLDHLIRAFLLVWVQHGADRDWGPMCYPPLRSLPGSD